jgi:hypothetical protein
LAAARLDSIALDSCGRGAHVVVAVVAGLF